MTGEMHDASAEVQGGSTAQDDLFLQNHRPLQSETEREGHVLRVSSLYKSFGKKRVVQGIDFSMHTGEVLGLLGPNG